MGVSDLQQSLLDVPRARWSDPETSFEAARSISTERLTQTQGWVLAALETFGPCTDEELLEAFRKRWPGCMVSPQSFRSRRAELRRKGLVVDSGLRRPTRYGQPSTVWRLA